MKKEDEIIVEAKAQLVENTNLKIKIKNGALRRNHIATIADECFVIVTKQEITAGNKGVTLAQINESSKTENLPVLLFTKYIPSAIAKDYIEQGINYIDTAGNCSIRSGSLFILIEGRKVNRMPKVNQSRAFQEAGIKLIYHLLDKQGSINRSFRELSEIADISLGSVSAIFKELEELNFILKTKSKRILKNKLELLNRWIIAYHDILRPRLLLKRMDFINREDQVKWNTKYLGNGDEHTLWGGETAAAKQTRQLTPEIYTIYTDGTWQSVSKNLKLKPSETGKVEILKLFCDFDKQGMTSIATSLLTYADLIGSGDSRNIEVAQIILDNELQYLK